MWSAQHCLVKKEGRMIFSGGLGTMGYAIPAAIGAHFAAPEKNVVAISGDGGFQMSIPELQTIKEFNIPVKILVINNEMLGLMKNFQDENFSGLHVATVIGYSVPDISELAKAYGLRNKQVSDDRQVEEALRWFNEEKGPLLLELKIPRVWGPYPKVLPGASLIKQHPPLPDDIENKIKEILL
jgi:acetolactate synthase-1/2/3 large subunit